jgi:ABC-2 type transport system ATP-binding protein
MTASAARPESGLPVSADGLTVRGPYGVIFDGVRFTVDAGALLVVHGPARCGRTTLLLALAGRHRLTAGIVDVGPHRLPQDAVAVRRAVAVAQAEPAVGLEGHLRVAEAIGEARIAGRVRPSELEDALAFFELDPPRRDVVDDLDPATRTLLAVALTWALRPPVLVVDDADRGCPPDERRRVWDGLARLTAAGCTVLAGAVDVPPDPPAQSLRLPHRTADQPRPAEPAQEEAQP